MHVSVELPVEWQRQEERWNERGGLSRVLVYHTRRLEVSLSP